ncbi:ABC transporter substrate-binding protein [Allokutzneria albata]|uniref:Carbohydrate ABC transporter substrate-binding protein, CUT1 family n=1 Tax=Allokutzneria albata TaxID=211114 RepID=A0A1H0DBV6_ALLAB|nr:extracellular solute-binding protein [Allokutzneria albata]SDN67644.1 carbohydrate ABC transporter substrate-binding protein, CUT1 family [Allokutzneria albata]
MTGFPRRSALRGALALGLLAGCSKPGGPARRTPGPGPARLTFWAWVPGIEKCVALWNSENPDVQVTLVRIPAARSGGYSKFYSSLEAGQQPDLMQAEFSEMPAMMMYGGLEDLTQHGVEQYRSLFVDWIWQQGAYGGGVYAIPQASGPVAMYYRRDLFDKWGIAAPKTWSEYAKTAELVRSHDAYLGTFPPNNGQYQAALAWQAGGRWFGTKDQRWTVDIDSEPTRRVLDFWEPLVRERLVKTIPDSGTAWYKDLADGNSVTWIGAHWADGVLRGGVPNGTGKWAVAPMPQWGGPFVASNLGGSSTCVVRGTAYPKEAMRFAVWLNTNPRSIALLLAGGYGWPALRNTDSIPELHAPSPYYGGQSIAKVFGEANAAVDTAWKWAPITTQAVQVLTDQLGQAVNGAFRLRDALPTTQRRTVRAMEKKGLPLSAG